MKEERPPLAKPGSRIGKGISILKFFALFLVAHQPFNEPGQRNDRNLADEKFAQFPEIFRFFDSFNKGKKPNPKDAEQIRVLIKEFRVLQLTYGILIQQLEEMVQR